MKLLPPERGFLGIDRAEMPEPIPERAAVIIPFGLEASVSYGDGTAKGPAAIIEASRQVELFDEDLWCEPFRTFGIETLAPFHVELPISEALEQLRNVTAEVLDSDRFPLVLGGEHSLSAGAMRAVMRKYPEVAMLHFDAHADLRDGYRGEHFSHASAIRRCLDLPGVSVVSCGIRNISAEEVPFLESNPERIHIFWAKDRKQWNLDAIVAALKERPVYISFDVDGFDSSLMPATGTPEPGGLFWDDAMAIIKAVGARCTVIGADVVELAPQPQLPACDFLAAKLVYKILAYALAKRAGQPS